MAKALDPTVSGECVEWSGSVLPSGYGIKHINGERIRAHRFAWQQRFGSLPDDLILHHKCRNKLCVNLNHLEPLTQGAHNQEHGEEVTHCPRGHKYTPENTYIRVDRKRGWTTRKCRTCHRIQESEKRHGRIQD